MARRVPARDKNMADLIDSDWMLRLCAGRLGAYSFR
jgi:hypothetical protein